MKILFLSRWFPYPTNNGSKLRIYNLLRGLGQFHNVTLLSFVDQLEVGSDAPEHHLLCSDIHIVPWREFDPHSLRACFGLLSLKPRSIIDTFSPEMARKITQLVRSDDYDLIIASQLPMATYHPYFNGIPALFEEIELGLSHEDSRRASDWMKRFRHAFTWFKLRTYLFRLLKFFRAVTVVSEQERELVLQYFPTVENIMVVPNCVNLADYRDIQAEPKPNSLVFTGSFRYRTNYEAMLWFIAEVFPLVLEQIPDAQLIITGEHANFPLPSRKNVTLAGYVDDVRSLIASSTVAIAPLWSGGGTRLKILEAMAIGTSVVATSKGAEGLEARSGEHLFVADDPIEFSNCVIKLLVDESLRRTMATKANLLVQEKYAWGRILPDFVRLAESIVVERNYF
jgi:glycosyltransferase involved in cell wall biosynthesis